MAGGMYDPERLRDMSTEELVGAYYHADTTGIVLAEDVLHDFIDGSLDDDAPSQEVQTTQHQVRLEVVRRFIVRTGVTSSELFGDQ